jgi:uncharacterized phage protein gp47/JayE
MSVSVPTLGPFVSPFIEDENTIRARLLSAVPTGLSQEPGTWVRDFVEINIAEFNLQYQALGWLLAQMFPAWATGQQLDAWGAAYGVVRGTGTFAVGAVRFYAPPGTAIPPTTVVEVPLSDPNSPRLQYQTTNPASVILGLAGYADVPVVALAVGVAYNQPPGAIALLDSAINNVTQVTNTIPLVGGEDPQTDSDYRPFVVAQASLPSGAGTLIDYVVWGNSVPGVGSTAVYTQWDTAGVNPGILDGRQNGSVLLSLRDTSNAPVDWSVVYNAQVSIDPSRELISMFELAEGWVSDPTLNAPAGPTLVVSDTGGEIPVSTTNNYLIVAVNGMGVSLPSPEASASAITTTATSTITVTWLAVPGATAYEVYGRTQGAEMLLTTVTGTSWLDDGTTSPGDAPPTANSSAPAPIAWDDADVELGNSSLQVQYPAGGDPNSPEATTVRLSRNMDLSRFVAAGEISMWVKSSDWSEVETGDPYLLFLVDETDFFSASLDLIAPDGTTPPVSGSDWWQWRISFSQFVASGTPDWAAISSIAVSPWVIGVNAVTVNFDYLLARYAAGAIGVGGLSPVGADVTCLSPVTLPVDVTISNSLLKDGYTLVDTPGTTNVTSLVTSTLNTYFETLQPGQEVRFVDVAETIHNTDGFVDFVLELPNAAGTPPSVPVAITQYAQLGVLAVS